MNVAFALPVSLIAVGMLAGCSKDDSPSSAPPSTDPVITSFSPTAGSIGTRIVISGSNFSPTPGENAVTFNGTAALVDTASSTRIVTSLPSGATSGPVVVVVNGKRATGQNFTVTVATWSSTAPMHQARAYHTATLLDNGKVLVAGGEGSGLTGGPCELFDPVTNSWTTTGSLAFHRSRHAAVKLQSGKVLVVGQSVTCELYDPQAGTWSPTGSISRDRWTPAVVLLANGKVLLAGGMGFTSTFDPIPLRTCQLYDPASGTWSLTDSMSAARNTPLLVTLPGNRVLVAGDGAAVCEIYDVSTGTWAPTAALPAARYHGTMTTISGGDVIFACGTEGIGSFPLTTHLFSSSAGTWTPVGSLATGRRDLASVMLPANGRVLVAGGQADAGDAVQLSSCELYNPVTRQWTPTASLSVARGYHTLTVLQSGKVLVAGGYVGYPTATNASEIYTP